MKRSHILGDFNINVYQKNKCIARDDNAIYSKLLSSDVKNYHQFCTMRSLKLLIKSPNRVTCSTSTLIDHILASFPSRVSQKGVIDVGISDHQLIICTRKISRLKTGGIVCACVCVCACVRACVCVFILFYRKSFFRLQDV